MKFRLALFMLLCTAACAAILSVSAYPALAARPATSTAAARDTVLAYLTDLPNRADNRVISGQFGFYGEGQTPQAALDTLAEIPARAAWRQVALTGADYGSYFVKAQGSLAEANRWLIERWQEGFLVNVSWHAPNPFDPAQPNAVAEVGTWDFKANAVRLLVTPGNPAYDRWRASLAFVADGLAELRDAGVVVIWRPFHEMNGAWFWWHWQPKPDFIALWRDMHQYFTVERGLDNLLWAYSPNAAWDEYAIRPDYYYPGDAFVDLVGLDYYGPRQMDVMDLNVTYTNPDTGQFNNGSYDQIAALGKPMGLFEFGPSPANGAGWDDPKYDYTRLVRDIRERYPKIVLFQAWEWIWRLGAHDNVKGLLTDPWVITLGELPDFTRVN